MEAIKALKDTAASGKPIKMGEVYKVPSEVSEKDARILIGMGKVAVTKPKRKYTKKEVKHAESI
ncbi:MAG: hypothetical protein GY934_03620 [Gammaproteobacteria bacterium]|nr:hypothetical protein [Gammaproteobacteria bacterium]